MDKYARLMQRLEIINVEFFKVCSYQYHLLHTLWLLSLLLTHSILTSFAFIVYLLNDLNSYRVYANCLESISISCLKALVIRMLLVGKGIMMLLIVSSLPLISIFAHHSVSMLTI